MSQLNKKTPYPYNDIVLFEKTKGEIHFKYIKNERGEFIDIRRYNEGRPLARGIRMASDTFNEFKDAYEDALREGEIVNGENVEKSVVLKKKK